MSEILVIVLLTAWILGILSSYTMGGTIHVLLVAALVVAAFRWIRPHSDI